MDPVGIGFVDEGTAQRCLVGRVSGGQGLGGLHQQPAKVNVEILVDQDALHRDAALTGVPEGRYGDPPGQILQIAILGIRLDHHRGVATQLEGDASAPRQLLQPPAHVHGTSEGDQGESVVSGEPLGVGPTRGDDGERALGQTGIGQDLGQEQGRGGRLGGRLAHHRTARGHGWRELVGHEVEREVERGDGQHRPHRHPADERCATGGRRVARQVRGLDFRVSGDERRFGQAVRAAIGLDPGEENGLAGLLADDPGQFLATFADPGRGALEDRATAGRAESCHGEGGVLRRLGCGLEHLGAAAGHPRHLASVEGGWNGTGCRYLR
jgi:hypothetical protein